MTYADSTERAALIGGLRALADYLESNPEVPAPSDAQVYIFPPDGTCTEKRAEIDVTAARLGATARPTAVGRHYVVTRSFGPVEYRAVAICEGHPHHDDNPDDESELAK
jgi:hypothetical protein